MSHFHSDYQRGIEVAPNNMEPVSVLLVLALLSAGSALVYLFKADHERRQKALQKQSSNPSSAIQPAAAIRRKSSQQQQKSAPKIAHHQPKQVPSQPQQQQQLQADAKHNKQSERRQSQPRKEEEPASSFDELDKSILIGVFNPPNCSKAQQKRPHEKSSHEKRSSNQASQERKVSQTKRLSQHQFPSDMLELHNGRPSADYSSEQLFNLIAASNLSKEEVELAVETLLNKLETSPNQHRQAQDWKQPKSDPLNRLKNQLKDNELALSTEIQNHEQTRARLQELKAQLQIERSASNSIKEEVIKSRKELSVINLALEQARSELNKQQLLNKQLKEESSKVINKLEQDNGQLEALLTNASIKENELRKQLEEKMQQLRSMEMNNQSQGEKVEELAAKLRSVELQLEQVRSSKHQDEYEACAKISDLESDSMRLDKALKDQTAHLKEVLESNNLLRKSVNELQVINGRQEEMLKRLRDERHVNEASMKRTLLEMEQELKELQSKLNASSASQDERLRKEMSQVERELNEADQREQKLMSEVQELRKGLAALLPDLNKSLNGVHDNEKVAGSSNDDWVPQYLAAIKHLAKTVEELREENNNLVNESLTPTKQSKSVTPTEDKSTLTLPQKHNSSRVSSPVANGRASKAGSHQADHNDADKKVMETKLLELEDKVAKLEEELEEHRDAEIEKDELYKEQIKKLNLEKTMLQAQVKFGLDALKYEKERSKILDDNFDKPAMDKAKQLEEAKLEQTKQSSSREQN